jgi:hypothetical protein
VNQSQVKIAHHELYQLIISISDMEEVPETRMYYPFFSVSHVVKLNLLYSHISLMNDKKYFAQISSAKNNAICTRRWWGSLV